MVGSRWLSLQCPAKRHSGLALPDPWSWKRDHQPWLQGLLGSTDQGPLVPSDAITFDHWGCSAVISISGGGRSWKRSQASRRSWVKQVSFQFWTSDPDLSQVWLQPLPETEKSSQRPCFQISLVLTISPWLSGANPQRCAVSPA